MVKRVAVFVDGENIAATFARKIIDIAKDYGSVDATRVYGNVSILPSWCDILEFQLIHSNTGKNATDMLLAIDAMELAQDGDFPIIIIASSDGDFSHLARRLRERGHTTIGIGEDKTPARFRQACHAFRLLTQNTPPPKPTRSTRVVESPTDLDHHIRELIATNSTSGAGMRISELGQKMQRVHGKTIRNLPEGGWRAYLRARDTLYDLDPKGPDAKVRFKKEGFAIRA